jgi:hypothetical protein
MPLKSIFAPAIRPLRPWSELVAPLLFLVVLIGLPELCLYLAVAPTFWERTNWLLHDPYRPESFDRLEVYEKLNKLGDTDPDIIMVGDSSGFFSIQSTIVNRYTNGLNFANFSTGANHAYEGYKAIAEYMLRRSTRIKFVVLYIYPTLLPSDDVITRADLGPILYDNLLSIKSYLTLPSAALSASAKFGFFEHRRYHRGDYLSNHKVYLEFANTVQETFGWVPEHDVRFHRFASELSFYPKSEEIWYQKMRSVLGDFNRMVRSHGSKLVVVFAPVPTYAFKPADEHELALEQALSRFQREFPDILFPTPLVTSFSDEKFGMFNHISREYTFLSSSRLGDALRKLLLNEASVPKFTPQLGGDGQRKPLAVSWHPLNTLDPSALKAAMAFYLYAATADESYRGLISKRVLDLLADEQSFGFMMQDTRKRIVSLNEKNITLGYDTSGLYAKLADTVGLIHCNQSPDVQWIHIEGVMKFTIRSPAFQSEEPVAWPGGSNILIPTVVEDGVRKFDGYCREPATKNIDNVPE